MNEQGSNPSTSWVRAPMGVHTRAHTRTHAHVHTRTCRGWRGCCSRPYLPDLLQPFLQAVPALQLQPQLLQPGDELGGEGSGFHGRHLLGQTVGSLRVREGRNQAPLAGQAGTGHSSLDGARGAHRCVPSARVRVEGGYRNGQRCSGLLCTGSVASWRAMVPTSMCLGQEQLVALREALLVPSVVQPAHQ